MFTIEMDHDETLITILDDEAGYEDVSFIVYDDIVYIRQWCEENLTTETITMSPEMFDEFCKALNLPEGSYYVRTNSVDNED